MGSSVDKDQKPARQNDTKGFPTPTSLLAAQQQYSKSKKPPARRNNGEVPEPFPPPTLKSQFYNIADYAEVDAHASKAPLKLAADSYRALVNYLIQPASDDIGQARSFFVWIASQRLQKIVDFVSDTIPPEDTPLYTVLLMLLKQWGNGYSELFSKLCKTAGIPCRIVKGKVKGSGYRLGYAVDGTNDYCIIYVSGCWRFVDPHWGSQYVISSVDNNDDWEMIRPDSPGGGGGVKTDASKQEEQIGYNCDDFYFLTDPVAMVYTHLTCDPKLQLLARPVTEKEFSEMAYLKDSFFELGMTYVSHPKCLVESGDNGTVVFEFGLDADKACSFTTELYKSAQDPALNTVEGFTFDQFCTLENLQDKLRVTIAFPKIGRYKFELDGKEMGSIEGYTSICEYSIQCRKPNFRFDPNPENARGEWGPGADTARYGLDPHGQDGGIIYAQDGRAVVAFRSNDARRVRFRYLLKNFEEPPEDLRECICHYKTGNLIIFLMKLPHKGKYTLEMYAKICEPNQKKNKKRGSQGRKDGKNKSKEKSKDKNKEKNSKQTKGNKKRQQDSDDEDEDDADSYESICNYLIKSDVGCYDLAPYPPLNNIYGQTGDVMEFNEDEFCLTSQTHPHAVIDPYDSGQMTITMEANKEPDAGPLRASMIRYYRHDGEEEESSDYVMMYKHQRTYKLDLQFPKVGFYKLSLTSGDHLVHQYLINVIQPDTTCYPYPVQGRGWRSDYELQEPKSGHLEADRKFLFLVRAPDSKKVKAVFDDGQEVLFKKKGDVWDGEVHTDPRGGGQLRIVTEESKSNNNVELLTYNILDGAQMDKMKTEQQLADKDADEHRREMNERREAEEKEAERRRKEEEEKARKAEEDFKKNRKKYEQEEALIISRVEEEELKEMEETKDESGEEIRAIDLQQLPSDSEKDKQTTPREEQTPRRHKIHGSDDKDDWHHYHPKPDTVQEEAEQPTPPPPADTSQEQPAPDTQQDVQTQPELEDTTLTADERNPPADVSTQTDEPISRDEPVEAQPQQPTQNQQPQTVPVVAAAAAAAKPKKKKVKKPAPVNEEKPAMVDEEIQTEDVEKKPAKKKKPKEKKEEKKEEKVEEKDEGKDEERREECEDEKPSFVPKKRKPRQTKPTEDNVDTRPQETQDQPKPKKKKKKKVESEDEDDKSELMKSMNTINQEELSQQMALEKLRESMRCRQHTMLKNAIIDCQSFDKLHDNKEVKNANKTLSVIEARQALQRACDNKNAKEIRREVERIREAGLTKYLQNETREAMCLVELLERMPANKSVLDMGKKLMTEIRRYQNPPPAMHRIMQSALLLLGEDEDTTDNWKACQRLCNPQGQRGLNRRMFEFQPDKVHPELVARSKEMLLDIDIAKVQAVGPAAITFYVWIRGSIEEAEEIQQEDNRQDGNDNNEQVKPASRDRQKEILGRLPPSDAKYGGRQFDPTPYSPRKEHSSNYDMYDDY